MTTSIARHPTGLGLIGPGARGSSRDFFYISRAGAPAPRRWILKSPGHAFSFDALAPCVPRRKAGARAPRSRSCARLRRALTGVLRCQSTGGKSAARSPTTGRTDAADGESRGHSLAFPLRFRIAHVNYRSLLRSGWNRGVLDNAFGLEFSREARAAIARLLGPQRVTASIAIRQFLGIDPETRARLGLCGAIWRCELAIHD